MILIAHDLEHGIGIERHSRVPSSSHGGCGEASSGRANALGDGHGVTMGAFTSEGIDVVLLELRSISARLTNVENSID